ncbi:MAG: hypothetical protein AAFV53_27475 [Myxococcota bacterium]
MSDKTLSLDVAAQNSLFAYMPDEALAKMAGVDVAEVAAYRKAHDIAPFTPAVQVVEKVVEKIVEVPVAGSEPGKDGLVIQLKTSVRFRGRGPKAPSWTLGRSIYRGRMARKVMALIEAHPDVNAKDVVKVLSQR